MKKNVFSLAGRLLIAAAIALPATAFAASDVVTDDFSVTLPDGYGEFTRQVQKVQAPSGTIDQVTYVSKAADGSAFIVTYGDLSGPITDPAAAMDGGRDSLVKSLNASVESENERQIDGLPGRTFQFSSQGATPIFARTDLAVTGPRMYQVIFLGFTPEARADAKVSQFFRSFDIRFEPEVTVPAEVTAEAPAAPAAPVAAEPVDVAATSTSNNG